MLESGFAIFSRNSSAKVLVMHQNKEKINKWYDNAFLQLSNSIEIAWEQPNSSKIEQEWNGNLTLQTSTLNKYFFNLIFY